MTALVNYIYKYISNLKKVYYNFDPFPSYWLYQDAPATLFPERDALVVHPMINV